MGEKAMRDLRRWNVRRVAEALEGAEGFSPFPGVADREAIGRIRDGIGDAGLSALLVQARLDVDAPVPALPASLYLDFHRTGRREPYEDAQRARRSMLYRLVLAEWLEGRGEFLAALENVAWARLEETNWAWPAHASTLDRPDHPTVDLAAAMTAHEFGEIDHLLGDRLDPALRARIRHEVERRVVGPFLDRHDHWWLAAAESRPLNNWTAVCVAGAVGAALYLEPDKGRLAEIVARGMPGLADYLETFDSEGGSSEGPDYWSYGFGNFVVLAHLLAERSHGRIDLFDDPLVENIARFPLRTVLAPGLWVSFSDSDERPAFHPGLLTALARRFDIPELLELGTQNDFAVTEFNQFAWPLRQYAWPLPPAGRRFAGTPHDWYDEMQWMIGRLDPADPDSLRLAVKGGHNAEMHNQNDVGALILAVKGRALIVDPGRGRYSKSYFGPARYENVFAASRGHSVPVVAGREQAAGRDRAARLIEHAHGPDADLLAIDIAAAYPDEAGIASLVRRVRLVRDVPGGLVELSDDYAFAGGPAAFRSVLVTRGEARIADAAVTVTDGAAAVEIGFDPKTIAVSLERHENAEKQYAPAVDLTRILFTARPEATQGRIALTIRPATA